MARHVSIVRRGQSVATSILHLCLPSLGVRGCPILIGRSSSRGVFGDRQRVLCRILFSVGGSIGRLGGLMRSVVKNGVPVRVPRRPTTCPRPVRAIRPIPSVRRTRTIRRRRDLSLRRIRGRVVQGTLRGRGNHHGGTTTSLGVSRQALCEGVGRCGLRWGVLGVGGV